MSWAGEEWKDGLSANVLDQILKLEQCVQDVENEKKQLKFQVETANAAIAKLKITEDEKVNEIKRLQLDLDKAIDKLNKSEEAVTQFEHELKEKDLLVERLKITLENVKAAGEKKLSEAQELQNVLDKLQEKYNSDIEGLKAENNELKDRLKEALETNSPQYQGRTDMEISENRKDEINADISKLMDENLQLRQLYDSQKRTIEDLQSKISNSEDDRPFEPKTEDEHRWSSEEICRLQQELGRTKEQLENLLSVHAENEIFRKERQQYIDDISKLKEKNEALCADMEMYKEESRNMTSIRMQKKELEEEFNELSIEMKEKEEKFAQILKDCNIEYTAECAKFAAKIEDLEQRLEEEQFKSQSLQNETPKAARAKSKDVACLVRFDDLSSDLVSKQNSSTPFQNKKEEIDWLRTSISDLLNLVQAKGNDTLYSQDLGVEEDAFLGLTRDLLSLSESLGAFQVNKVQHKEWTKQKQTRVVENGVQTGDIENGVMSDYHEGRNGKKNERWNVEVFDLRLKVNELEKRNQELKAKVERSNGLVGGLRKTYEAQSPGENMFIQQNKKSKELFHCAASRIPSSDSRSFEDLVRANQISEEKLSLLYNEKDRWERILKRKDETIQLLEKNMKFLTQEKKLAESNLQGQLRAKTDEVEALKTQLRTSDFRIKQLSLEKDSKNQRRLPMNATCHGFSDTCSVENVNLSLSSDVSIDDFLQSQDDDPELRLLLNESYGNISYLEDMIAGQRTHVARPRCSEVEKTARSLTNLMSAECIAKVVPNMGNSEFQEKFTKLKQTLKEIEARIVTKDRLNASLVKKLQCLTPRACNTVDSATQLGLEDFVYSPNLVSASTDTCDLEFSGQQKEERVFDTWQSEETMTHCRTVAPSPNKTARVEAKGPTMFERDSQQCFRVQKTCSCDNLERKLADAKMVVSSYEEQIKKLKDRNIEIEQFWEQKLKQSNLANETVQKMENIAKEEYMKQERMIIELETKLAHQVEKTNQAIIELQEAKRELKHHIDQPKLDVFLNEVRHMIIGKVEEEKSTRDEMKQLQNDLFSDLACNSEKLLQAIQESVANSVRTRQVTPVAEKSPMNNLHTGLEQRQVQQSKMYPRYGYKRRNIEEEAYVTAKHVVGTLDELEKAKCSLCYVQDDVQMLLNTINKLEREKEKLNQEMAGLLSTLQVKEEEIGKLANLLDKERNTVEDNERAYQSELEVLKVEQIEIYKEFRDLCDAYKKKELELVDKSKQVVNLEAKLKDQEETLNDKMLVFNKELEKSRKENNDLRHELDSAKSEIEEHIRRLKTSKNQMTTVYQRLTCIDNMFYDCRQKGLYN